MEELIRRYIENYNEYLDSTIDYPDEAEDDYNEFLNSEKEILEYYGISQKEKLHRVLYIFIENSCFENKVLYTDKIASKINNTMKKLGQIEPYVSKMDSLFQVLYKEFISSPLVEKKDLKNVPGIYVFFKNEYPIYVGRTDNIKERVQYHTRPKSGNGSATFAFNLAKEEYERKYKVTIKNRKTPQNDDLQNIISITRKELEKDERFEPIFDAKKKYLSNCKFRFIEIKNDIIQTMFEPYLAYKLGTYPINNTFENH